ncbi:SAM-dependent methyltransferase, partial [Pseudomonadales bacterium]|nr:SAM-dependent methyltransferase [Pseudomonadales bacterium]
MSVLYVVATPIGNLEDMTYRAVSVLKNVDYIAAEDTRHSKRLLVHYDISTPMLSYHEHNETESSAGLVALLEENKSIALISDAGTPLIADPGYRLVR